MADPNHPGQPLARRQSTMRGQKTMPAHADER
jgi:hypothetical protein